MILYGASGHCKVIIDILTSSGEEISYIFDDDKEKKSFTGYTVLNEYSGKLSKGEKLIISIGDNKIRKNISSLVTHKFGNAIHTSSIVCNNVKIGEGTVVFHNSVIQSSSVLGRHVIINTSASIDHDCIIDAFVHISPNATLCGNVTVGEGTHIGAAAVVLPNINIGKWCRIGAGSVIIRDIPDNCTVVGNPGKVIKTEKLL